MYSFLNAFIITMQALLSLLSSIMKDGLDLVDKQVPHKERQSRTSISTMRYIERVPCKTPCFTCNTTMLESLVASILNRFLGNYVSNLNYDQLNIGVWKGKAAIPFSLASFYNGPFFNSCFFQHFFQEKQTFEI